MPNSQQPVHTMPPTGIIYDDQGNPSFHGLNINVQSGAVNSVLNTSQSLSYNINYTETGAVPDSEPPDIFKYMLQKKIKWSIPDDGDKVMPDTEQFYNRKITVLAGLHSSKRQKGLIGLEIECEGTHLFNTPFVHWSCHSDGSLREVAPGHPPVEYVLKAPLDRPELVKALKYLEKKLQEAGSSIVQSNRTSVHVHINAQEMTLRELYCYILLYIIFEEVLVEWSGPERAGNLFCLRAKDSDYYIEMLESVLKKHSLKAWKEDSRYAACNVASIPKFGSIEFRSLRGTVDVELILTWVDMLLLLKEKASGYDNPIEIVDDFIRLGPLPFFKQIFSDNHLRQHLENLPNLSSKLWDGLRLMRDVAHASDWKPPKKKEEGQPEQEVEKPRYLNEQKIPTRWGMLRVYAKEGPDAYHCCTYNEDSFLSEMLETARTYQIPPGHTMYFLANVPGGGGYYFILDVREGDIESEIE